ncbi:MAG: hypothetical protein AB7P33_04000 [Dehalococcoidia bacterium]
MPSARFALAALFVALLSLSLTACGSDKDEDEPPTAQEQAAFCVNIANTRNSMADVRDALLPLDEVAMQEARADVRADIDYLEGSSFELQGGRDEVLVLKQDINQLLEIMATPSLVSVTDEIRAQVQVISADLDSLEALGDCP